MAKKKSYIDVTDQFCGAGGSSQGVRRAAMRLKGLEVKLAMNHWKLAIETHNTNFPDTLHDCTDISACDPRRYPSTRILITSPECTNHSLAKGVKQVKAQLGLYDKLVLDPAAERSRATMWDVCRFAEYHSYDIIIVENVVDARKWVMWEAWLKAMHLLGYKHECVYMNSMFCHPTPQSRDRMYVVFWKAKNKKPNLDQTPLAWCPICGKDVNSVQAWKNPNIRYGKYKTQYIFCCPVHGTEVKPYYYAAYNVIDWSDRGQRIGDRAFPLSDNTIRRIEYGIKKYGGQSCLIKNYGGGFDAKHTPVGMDEAIGTVTTSDHHGLLSPFIMNIKQTTGVSCRVKDVTEPVPTLTGEHGLTLVSPFIVKLEHSSNMNVSTCDKAFPTQTTRQSLAVVMPMIVELNSSGKAKPATNAFSTVTAGAVNQSIVSSDSFNAFVGSYYGNMQASHVSDPLNTCTSTDRHFLIQSSTKVEDCYYRMLKPKEVQLAMAFDDDYIILGNGKEKVKQCGNAVTPPAMEFLIERCVESLN
jgi:DNA (cytosine-5)-methyltransferase 1